MTKNTPKKAQTKRKAKAKPRSKPRTKANTKARKRWHPVLRIGLQLSIIGATLLAFWMIYLNAIVKEGFAGSRFQIPARVYSEAQELYAGAPIRHSEFVLLLDQLGYRSNAIVSQPGRFRVINTQEIEVYTRAFRFWDGQEPSQRLNLRFNSDGIQSVRNSQGQNVMLSRLDPLYLGQIYPGAAQDRILVRLNEYPELLILGLLLVEDDRFFEHYGISLRGIARAFVGNVASGSMTQGGSTITQQLVKNLYLTSERKLTRKIKEALMSILLEVHYDKNDILETYMNEVYVGQQGARAIHGFGLAAQFFFASTVQDLTIHQQALLVGLIKGPSYYNPRRFPDRAKARRNTVLDVWHTQGLITDAEWQRALTAPLDVLDQPGQASFPAFMDGVRRQLAESYRKDDLMNEGLQVFTTLNPVAQKALEQQVIVGLQTLETAQPAKAEPLQIAGVLTRPSTGDVMALVGDRNVKAIGFNRALDAQRPVGSLMKPAVYLAALEQGRSLVTPISDDTVAVAGRDGEIWQPQNYDKQSHGTPLLVDALANSYNQATARLGMEIGLINVFDAIKRLGVSGNVPAVPAVMLGAHGMSPMQVAQMYQTIAGNGFYTPLNFIRAVSHPEQGLLQRFDLKVEKRFEPSHIHLLQHALTEVTTTGTARSLSWRMPNVDSSWGKTGTTDDYRDAWYAGVAGDRQLVVWLGHDDNSPIGLSGSSGALPIWANVMNSLEPMPERLSVPAGIEYAYINASGVSVPEWCDSTRFMPFLAQQMPPSSQRCSATDSNTEPDAPSWLERIFGR